jgi:2-polyprenyl-3-methyl-5-hydroxy-6-metoxy-1,4-benzoquinol methylase
MKRIPEAELMNDQAQVQAYAMADFEEPHNAFIEYLQQYNPELGKLSKGWSLDLGCGPGDITRRFALAYPSLTVDAVDAAGQMITMAEYLNRQHNLQDRIHLHTKTIDELEPDHASYEIIFSNSLLHHLHNPADLWQTLKRLGNQKTAVFIMDLMRPDNTVEARHLVDKYAQNEPDILREDFYHSLCAAYRIDEVQQQLIQSKLNTLQIQSVSDRHMIIHGQL